MVNIYFFLFHIYIYIYKIFGKYFTAGKPEYLKKTNEKKRKKRIGNTANYINPLCKGKTTITTTKKKRMKNRADDKIKIIVKAQSMKPIGCER